MKISGDELLGQLREAVGRLAMAAADQLRWLEENHVSPDELALELDDAVPGWFPRLESLGLLSEDAKASLLDLLARLGAIGADSVAWRREALETSPDWSDVRALASVALRKL